MAQVEIKSADEIALMREAGRIVCEILDELEKAVAPGVTTWDLDALAEKLIYKKGAKPAFKGYRGFFGDSARTVPVGKVSREARG
jgi:methionyl aminopeptidase